MVPIIAAPIISRLYTPTDLGKYALYSSIITIAINIVCLKFDQAIVLPKNKFEGNRLFKLAMVSSQFFATLTLVLLLLAKGLVFLGIIDDFSNWWFLLSIHIYILGIYQASNYFVNRLKLYSALGRSRIYNGIFYTLFQLSFFKLNELGLVLSLFLSRSIASVFLLKKVIKNSHVQRSSVTKYKPVFSLYDKILAKKYKDFPLYSMPNTLLNSTSNQLPIFLLQSFYSAQITGLYSWANRIIQIPMGFVISSMQQVFYQEVAARVADGKSIYGFVVKTYKKLFVIGIVPYTVVFIFAPQIFSFIFGEQWTQAGVYTRYLIPWLFVVFMNSPITGIVPILGKQKSYFINELILFVLRGIALCTGYFIFNDESISIILFGIVGFAYNIFLLFYLLRFAKYESV